MALCIGAGTAAHAESIIVLNSEDASYSIVSRSGRNEVARLPLGREPHHYALTPDGKELLIASTVTNELVALDTTTGEKKGVVRDIIDPYQLAFSPDGKWFVTTAYRLDHVDIYRADGFRLVSRIFIDGMPSHMAFDADSKTVFITLQQSNRVVAFDLATQMIKWNVEVGKATAGVLMLPDNKRLLVALTGEDAVVVMDPKDGSVTSRLQTGKGAHNFWPKGDGRHWFLSNRIENTVSLIDTQEMRVVATIRVWGGPDDMEVTADGKELWVTQRFLRRVAIVDLAQLKVVASVPVGKSPHGLFILKGTATAAGGVPIRAASTESDRK
jgi:DNA-binding beta-propeller fold protein YncE